MPYLGYILTPQGIRPSPYKLDILRDWPQSTSAKHVQQFLGFAGYYRKLIQKIAMLEAPLRDLTKKGVPFHWDIEQQTAFNTLKTILNSDSILALPDFSRKFTFEVQTDASDTAIGAVLSQTQPDGTEKPIQYASRVLTEAERKWSTREEEALAIVWAVDYFRPYLIGDHLNITTDHASLEQLQNAHKGRIER